MPTFPESISIGCNHTHFGRMHAHFDAQNCAECAIIKLNQFGSHQDMYKCLVEVSIRQDGTQDLSNREYPNRTEKVDCDFNKA